MSGPTYALSTGSVRNVLKPVNSAKFKEPECFVIKDRGVLKDKKELLTMELEDLVNGGSVYVTADYVKNIDNQNAWIEMHNVAVNGRLNTPTGPDVMTLRKIVYSSNDRESYIVLFKHGDTPVTLLGVLDFLEINNISYQGYVLEVHADGNSFKSIVDRSEYIGSFKENNYNVVEPLAHGTIPSPEGFKPATATLQVN